MTLLENENNATLILKVETFVEKYMSQYDPSHDYNHVLRVRRHALALAQDSRNVFTSPPNLLIVNLAALLHDVGDHKYAKEGDVPLFETFNSLLENEELAHTVLQIVQHVSYSHEQKHPEKTIEMCATIPELAIVQDADRIEAIGAIGMTRCFMYGAVKNRPLSNSLEHFHEKLYFVKDLMKTKVGKEMAIGLEKRMRMFEAWIQEESA